jgi:hypothetical protein
MIRACRVLVLLALLLCLAGNARSADDKMPTSPWFPTAVGTTWQYRAGEARFVVKVTKHEKVGSLMCARLEAEVNKKTVYFEHVAVTGKEVVRAGRDGKAITPPLPFLKLPPEADKSWNVETKVDSQVLKGTFKAGPETSVKVPAGTYKAVTVTGQDLDASGVRFSVTYYFAEKVGLVRQVIDMAGQKIDIVLEKYEAGKE